MQAKKNRPRSKAKKKNNTIYFVQEEHYINVM